MDGELILMNATSVDLVAQ